MTIATVTYGITMQIPGRLLQKELRLHSLQLFTLLSS